MGYHLGMDKKPNTKKRRDPFAVAVISELGGIAATARIFRVKPPSIVGWLNKGIPDARMMYLEAVYPKVIRKARKIKVIEEVDIMAASDDVQPNAGGTIGGDKAGCAGS